MGKISGKPSGYKKSRANVPIPFSVLFVTKTTQPFTYLNIF